MDVGRQLKSLMLRPPRLTLAVAESVTCGRLQAAIGAVSGASEFFLGGLTAYSIDQKVRQLGVDRSLAERINAVSPEVAAQMACGTCLLFRSDLALATTGYAEPAPALKVDHPLAFWALARRQGPDATVVREGSLERAGLGRIAMQREAAAATLKDLVAYLREWRAAGARAG